LEIELWWGTQRGKGSHVHVGLGLGELYMNFSLARGGGIPKKELEWKSFVHERERNLRATVFNDFKK